MRSNLDSWKNLITTNLLNFTSYLWVEEFYAFCKWLMLHQSVIEILGENSGGLRNVHNTHKQVYDQLLQHFDYKFMLMTPNQDKNLTEHKNNFFEVQRRYSILSYVIKNFSNFDNSDSAGSFNAILYFFNYTRERTNAKG